VSRSCPVCEHEDLKEINAALASNERIRTIADRWSVSKIALMRHRNEHLPVSAIEEAKEAEAREAEVKEAEEDVHADELLDQVRDLQERTLTILGEAEEAEELSSALQAITEAKDNLERLGKRLSELDEHS
jgi:Zn-dependent peptidase ImmA (M78 family)